MSCLLKIARLPNGGPGMLLHLLVLAELWGVGGQDLAFLFRDEALGFLAVVLGRVIGDDQDRLAGVLVDLVEKGDEARRVDALGNEAEAHILARGHRADDRQAEARTTVTHHGGLNDLAPGEPPMGIASHRRLIDEVDVSAHGPGFCHGLREGLGQMGLDLPWILPIGVVDRPLRTQPRIPQQATDSALHQLNAPLAGDMRMQQVEGPTDRRQTETVADCPR